MIDAVLAPLAGPGRDAAAFLLAGAGLAAMAALLTAGLLRALHPLLQRYALARPNARSSHSVPTPQGAGVAIVAVVVLLGAVALALAPPGFSLTHLAVLFVAAIGLAIVGAIDDIRPLPAAPRFLAHAAAVVALVMMLPAEARLVPLLPLAIERALVVLAGIWFVNLTNFMDGLDWITAAQMVPLGAGIVLLATLGAASADAALVALLLLGALVGFAPANKPVAKLFLGDVGSLPIGLLAGFCLLDLAARGALMAALLLPLYYLADATITLLRRAYARERIWEAHRSHFYQRATTAGLSVMQVVGRVFALNLALVALAIASVVWSGLALQAALLAVGALLVGVVLVSFERGWR